MDKSESVIDSMGHQFSQSNMPSIKISKKHHKHINNPFPGTPKSLPFVHGNLFCNSQTFKQHQVFQVGIDFLLTWSPENGGSLSISHQSQPNRTIWSTVPGQAFVSAAMAETEVEESRGSFVIKDGEVSFICQHQSIEDIKMINEFDIGHDEDHDFPSGSLRLIQETDFSEQFKEAQFPVLLITGKIFNSKKKKKIERSINRHVDFETKKFKYGRVGKVTVSAKYWFFLYQENAHQIGFRVKFGKPISKFHQRTLPRDSRSLWSLKWKWGKFRKRRIGWFTNTGGYAKISAEEREVKVGEGTEFNRVFMTYSSEEDEKFYGFGEQFSHMEFKGRRVPIFVQEQGIGRGDQPITFAANLVSYRSGGDWSTTYAPSPFYMTSKMRSLYLEGYSYSVFDLTKHDRIQIQIYSGNAQGRIIYGNSPTELIERFTETIGRPPELPNWIISGAVVGMQGGTESVRRVWDQLQEYDAPISAFWLQDWVGQRETIIGSQLWWNWEVDTTRYAGWLKLVNDLRAHGIRMMAYCNPCLAPTGDKPNTTRNLFEEANKLGIFVKDKTGETYMIPNTAFEVGMLDFTNPAASSWFKQILWEMVDSGVMGWMADFGEGLPLDACLFSGEDPVSAHNRYPEIWAKINREFVDEWKSKHYAKEREDPEESLVFFVRAGFRESPKWAMLFWEGDQMVSWQKNDGIKSAVVGLLSSGLSGYALNHSDIGGYCAVNIPFVKYRRSEELLLRWMELNAFSTVFRTHEGNNPSANIQFYSNHRTLSQFARFAKVYEAWKFYRIQLVKEAAHKGLPVSRHLFLHFPNDKHVHNLTYQQFLVGTEILVAPVLDKGKEEVKVYFPLGGGCSWQHIWTGKVYSGPLNCSDNKSQGFETWVEARIGFPAVFVKFGSPIGKTFQKNLKDLNIL